MQIKIIDASIIVGQQRHSSDCEAVLPVEQSQHYSILVEIKDIDMPAFYNDKGAKYDMPALCRGNKLICNNACLV